MSRITLAGNYEWDEENPQSYWRMQSCGCKYRVDLDKPDRFSSFSIGKVERCPKHQVQWDRICVMAKRGRDEGRKARRRKVS